MCIGTDLNIKLLESKNSDEVSLLSIGYGGGHIVALLKSKDDINKMLNFMESHRKSDGADWCEFGRFGEQVVSLYIDDNCIGILVDTDVAVDGFGQSCGIHMPRNLLEELHTCISNLI